MRAVSNAEMAEYWHLAERMVRSMLYRLPTSVNRDDILAPALEGLWQALANGDPERQGFESLAMRRIYWAIADELRAMDPLSRRERKSGEYSFLHIETGDGAARVATVTGAQLGAPDPHLNAVAARVDVAAALKNLPLREAKILVDEYLLERSQVDTAKDLGLSAPRVNQLRDRALRRMAYLLEDLDDDT